MSHKLPEYDLMMICLNTLALTMVAVWLVEAYFGSPLRQRWEAMHLRKRLLLWLWKRLRE